MILGVTRLGAYSLGWIGRRQHPLWQLLFRLGSRIQQKLNSSAFSRSVSTMLLGTILGQVTSVLLSPVLTRLYSPEQFAALSVYTSALSILIVAASLRYEIPMATAQTSSEVVNLMALCSMVLVCTTGAVAALSALIPQATLGRAGMGDLGHYRLLLPAGYFILGIYYIVLYAATWAQEFEGISRTRISQGVSGPVSQIVMGLFGLGSGGLALGFVIGQSAGTTLLFHRMVIRRWATLKDIRFRLIRQIAWKYRDFPLISAWAGMIDAAGYGYLAYILVAALYPGPLAGYMFLAERVVSRPLQMISGSMLTVFMGEIGRSMVKDPRLLRRRFLQVTSRQLLLGGGWVAAIDTVAALAFPRIFGSVWEDATPYLIAMSFTYLANSVIMSVYHTLQALRRQLLAAVWQVGRVGAVILVFVLCSRAEVSALTTITIYAATQVVACVIVYLLMKKCIERLPMPAQEQVA